MSIALPLHPDTADTCFGSSEVRITCAGVCIVLQSARVVAHFHEFVARMPEPLRNSEELLEQDELLFIRQGCYALQHCGLSGIGARHIATPKSQATKLRPLPLALEVMQQRHSALVVALVESTLCSKPEAPGHSFVLLIAHIVVRRSETDLLGVIKPVGIEGQTVNLQLRRLNAESEHLCSLIYSPSQAHVCLGFCGICNLSVGYMGHGMFQLEEPPLELLYRVLRYASAIRSIHGAYIMPQGSQRHPHRSLKSGYFLGFSSHGIQQLRNTCEELWPTCHERRNSCPALASCKFCQIKQFPDLLRGSAASLARHVRSGNRPGGNGRWRCVEHTVKKPGRTAARQRGTAACR